MSAVTVLQPNLGDFIGIISLPSPNLKIVCKMCCSVILTNLMYVRFQNTTFKENIQNSHIRLAMGGQHFLCLGELLKEPRACKGVRGHILP